MNIRSLARGLVYRGEAKGKRQTYYVFESAAGYVVMSASRTKRASGYFNLVSRDAVNRIRRSYAGKQDVTAKALGIAVIAYALSPIDLIPDFIPVIGWIDDLLLVPLGLLAVRAMIPKDVLEEYRARADELSAPRR